VVDPVDNNIERLEDIRVGREVALRVLTEYEESPEAFDHDLLSPPAITRYFDYYFYRRAEAMDYPTPPETTTRSDTLLRLLSDNGMSVDAFRQTHEGNPPLSLRQAFRTAAKAFKAIDAPTKGVIVPYGPEGRDLIEGLRGPFDPETQTGLLRRAQQYSVNVFPNVFDRLLQSDAIQETCESTGIYYLLPDYYSEEFGLSESPVPNKEAGDG
jgi:CRISPR-associated endonuclease/helicase Cas3